MTTLLTTRYVHRAPFALEAVGIQMPALAEPHLNMAPFSGVVTRIDEPSTRAPGGADGHRVFIPRAVAEAALPTLIGMGVDMQGNLRDHDRRFKIGMITEAHIDGNDVVIHGHLFQKDFAPEIEQIRANRNRLGFSYEISDVRVVDANAPIWELTSFVFTGAAILLKSAAAYQDTAIAASAEEIPMAEKSEILDELRTLHATVDSLKAAQEASEDEEAARHAEEEASREAAAAAAAMLAAKRAREDADEEDAAKHDEAATGARTRAYTQRASAIAAHKALAAKKREASEEEAAARHDAEAKRLEEEDARCKEEDAAAEKALAATKQLAAGADDEDMMARMMATFMRAMYMGQEEEASAVEAAKKPAKSDMDEDMWGRMMAKMFKAMTFSPGVTMGKKRQEAAAKHADEAQDRELFRKLLRQDKGEQSASSTTDLKTRRDIRDLKASVELLTDAVKKVTGLLTDTPHSGRNLATDGQNGPNGGAAPVRKTMQATGEAWVSKFPEEKPAEDADVKELTAQMEKEGLTTQQQMARLLEHQYLKPQLVKK